MRVEPPPQVKVFNWIWQKWLANVQEWINFEASTVSVITTAHNAGDEQIILVDDDTAGGAVTVTLPLAAGARRPYHIKKLGTTGNVVIDGNGSETVDTSANYTITTQYQCITVASNGAGWFII